MALRLCTLASLVFLAGCATQQTSLSEADRAKTPPPPVMSVGSEPARTSAADDARNPNLTRKPPLVAATPVPKREAGAAVPSVQNIVAKGRISVTQDTVRGPSQTQGSFELNADAKTGRLEFFNPLGGTVAVLAWSPNSALLRRPNGEVQPFDSPELMVQSALGIPLAPAVLVQWLRGEPVDNAAIQGLSADGFRQYGWNVSVERDTQEPAVTQRSGYPKRLDFSRIGSQKLDVRIALQEVVLVREKQAAPQAK